VALWGTILALQKEFLVYKNNELVFQDSKSEFALSAVTKDYQGPVFFYNLNLVRDRAIQLQTALKNVRLFYALKANAHPHILQVFKEQNIGIDVVSGGEIQHAVKCGFSYSQLVYSGVGKTIKELELAISNDIYQINVESIPELERIGQIAARLGKRANVAFRINPDISFQTHPYIATGLKDNKFGIDTGQLGEIISVSKKNKSHLSVKGISLHLGSQMMEFSSIKDSLAKLKPLFHELRKEFAECHRFDIGGGLGIYYEKQDLVAENNLLQDYAKTVFSELDQLKNEVPDLELQSEPGRWLVGHCGVLIAQVQYVKQTPHKEFVIIDSGMNHLLRPSLYEAYHGIQNLVQSSPARKKYDIVGPICESADFFGKDRDLTPVKADDFIIIRDCGAYAATMSSDYNLQNRAQELTTKDF
jgi:diaminopimelate decarboxylase